jgi:hypothetical protein
MDVIGKSYAAGTITLATFAQIIDELIVLSATGHYGNFDKTINHGKDILINSSLKKITDYTSGMYTLMDENNNPGVINTTIERNAPIFNEALNYLIKLGDGGSIEKFVTDRNVSLRWLNNLTQLKNLIAVMNADTAAYLFINAHLITHLAPAKMLQFALLKNKIFYQAIVKVNPFRLRDTFTAAKWELADFENHFPDNLQTAWMMLTQDNVIAELASQCKLEDLLSALDSKQLHILFEKFPAKIMALLEHSEISVEAHQHLARRLLKLNKATLGANVEKIIKIGIYKMSPNYNLTDDKDGIYDNALIAEEIAAKIAYSNFPEAPTLQAYKYLLTNIHIMAHKDVKRKKIQSMVATAGKHLPPSDFLECINQLAEKNKKKSLQVLSYLPDFLISCGKWNESETVAVKILADKYYEANPDNKGKSSDPVMSAVKLHNAIYYGSLIFAEGQTVHLKTFLQEASKEYKIPNLLSDELVNGFILGAKLGILGFGTAVVIDKFTSLANIVNPLAWITATIPGNAFITAAAGLGAALTGAGLASTIAIIVAPLVLSILVGGLIGAITNVGGHGIINSVRRAFNYLSDYVRNAEPKDNKIHHALIHGLRHANPQILRNQLYNDANHELRDNLAKTLLDQESKGNVIRGVPAEIMAIVEPIKSNYYDTHKSILFKLPDYVLGNMMSAIAFALNIATLFVFDLYYPGPISNYLSYHSQKKLAAAMPDNSPAELPATPTSSHARIQSSMAANPATTSSQAAQTTVPAAVNTPVVTVATASNDVALPPPPAYSPPRRRR